MVILLFLLSTYTINSHSIQTESTLNLIRRDADNLFFMLNDIENNQEKDTIQIETNELTHFGNLFFDAYQTFISSQDQTVCMFHPSCSNFSKSAVKKYGVVYGLLLTADRIQRCNGLGLEYYSEYDSVLETFYDPVTKYELK